MNPVHKITRLFSSHLNNFRHSLAYFDALPQLTLLGLLVGVFTGGIIVAFRFMIEMPLSILMTEHPDNFESLNVSDRVLFIFAGLFALAILLKLAGKKHSEVSVAHVLERIHGHQGKMPLANWLVQFLGAIIALVSGQSVGKEGPAVHLGAGAASQLGQWLRLPNNSMHTLIGCGVAAAIAAAFDTPMAGVIFAMEVIVMEYTIVGFVPVILSSVMGTMMSQAAFGKSGLIVIGTGGMNSLLELPYMVIVGLSIAACASAYIRLNIYALHFQHHSIYLRLLAAGIITVSVAVFVPQVMGVGYDTVNAAINGNILIGTLLLIGVSKLVVTALVIGLGVPGGVIGPLLVIGACAGGAMGLLLHSSALDVATNPGFYVILGMTGMMAATLNAPLAALVAVLELSYNPNMIFPAMLVIVVACVATRQLFKLDSIFIEQLRYSGRDLDFGTARQALRRAGVRSIMDTRFVISPQYVTVDDVNNKLATNPMWLVFENDGHKISLRAADLAAHIKKNQEALDENEDVESERDEASIIQKPQALDLLEIPGRRLNLLPIHDTANLVEALEALQQSGAEGLYVSKKYAPLTGNVQGIVTLAAIENYYQPKEFKNAMD